MRKTTWGMATAVLILMLAPCTQAKADQASQLRAADLQFRQAMIRGDAALVDRLVADDAEIIHGGHGTVAGKRELLDQFQSWRIDVYERTPLLTRITGSLAVMVSETRKVANGEETRTATTEVFTRRAGRWQILVLQNTDHAPQAAN